MSNLIAFPSGLTPVKAHAGATDQDRETLAAIFRQPMSHSLVWRDILALLTSIGDIDERRGGEFSLRVQGKSLAMVKPKTKDMGAVDLIALRHFLSQAGWGPDAAAPAVVEAQDPSPGLVVVIDHAGAKVFKLAGGQDSAAVSDKGALVRYLAHHIERQEHDRDRGETFPEDIQFFEQVAVALGRQGKIVLIGHGKGQSNEAEHLSRYLLAHHRDDHARIVAALLADLNHLSAGEVLELGRNALLAAKPVVSRP